MVVVRKISLVGKLAVLVALAGKDAPPTDCLEAVAQSSDSCEEVDKGEAGRASFARSYQVLQRLDHRFAWLNLTGFPAIGGPLAEFRCASLPRPDSGRLAAAIQKIESCFIDDLSGHYFDNMASSNPNHK